MAKITQFSAPIVHGEYPFEGKDYHNVHVKQLVTSYYTWKLSPFVEGRSEDYESSRYAFCAIPNSWTAEQTKKAIAAGRVLRIMGLDISSVLENPYDPDEGTRFRKFFEQRQADAEAGLPGAAEKLEKLVDQLSALDKDGNPILHKEYQLPIYRRLLFVETPVDDVDFCQRDYVSMLSEDDVAVAVGPQQVVEEEA